ncbi:NADPH-dependent FMN reductase [Salinarimonas sp. NSM]|uniref:NADPH-dependent FMN reductase n=1 Tax=Salinarimonas sp. NSM TaxID=3458003 RepID=UPI004036DD6D
MRLLGLSGSLRRASSSTAFLEALFARLPEGVERARADIRALPHYDADIDGGAPVAGLIEAIRTADGLVIVTPEYNYSIPGVLKNAIDWASRPSYRSVFAGKPVLVASVSGGALGGVRAQAHLKYVLDGMLAEVFPHQEIVVPHTNAKVTDGVFSDEATLAFALGALERFRRGSRSSGGPAPRG